MIYCFCWWKVFLAGSMQSSMMKSSFVYRFWTRNILMSRHQVGIMTGSVKPWGMSIYADIVTAIKTAKTMVGAILIRNTWTPTLVFDCWTLCLLSESEMGTNSIVWFGISFFWWHQM